MSTHNIPFFIMKTEKHPKSSQICCSGISSKGLKNEFETAAVDEPSVFEPLKFCCISCFLFILIIYMGFIFYIY